MIIVLMRELGVIVDITIDEEVVHWKDWDSYALIMSGTLWYIIVVLKAHMLEYLSGTYHFYWMHTNKTSDYLGHNARLLLPIYACY